MTRGGSRPGAACHCGETYPQLIAGRLSHGPGCAHRSARGGKREGAGRKRRADDISDKRGIHLRLTEAEDATVRAAAALEGVDPSDKARELVVRWAERRLQS